MIQRTIKFRGLRTDGVGWAYGYFVKTPITTEFNCTGQFLDSGGQGRFVIVTKEGVAHEIDPETVGQWTGITDDKVEEIYDGDLVSIKIHLPTDDKKIGKIFWNKTMCRFSIKTEEDVYKLENCLFNNIEVVGNIHQNPEILKKIRFI